MCGKCASQKLSGGDMVAQDAKYHVRCLVSLYNKARACNTDNKTKLVKSSDQVLHGIALALIVYIDEAQSDEVSPVFRLADLMELYSARLKQLGLEKQVGRIHSTRLKERILAHLPGIRAHSEGRDVLLAFDTDVGLALRKACEKDSDDEVPGSRSKHCPAGHVSTAKCLHWLI